MTAELIKATGQWMNNKTIVEYADTPTDAMEVIQSRFDPSHNLFDENFMNQDHAYNRLGSAFTRDFMGLKGTPEEAYKQLWGMFQGGTDKTDLVAEVNTAANDFHNTMGALTIGYEEEFAPSGTRIDPNKAVKGDPNCFIRSKPIEMGFPVVKIAIDCSILGSVSVEDVVDRGKLICEAIVRAELGGYKTRITAMSCTKFDQDNIIATLALNLKREDEPMNYSRVLYPILEPSFLRGVSFSWRSTLPELKYSQTMNIGASLYGRYNAAARREFYDDVVGGDTIVFSIGALCEEMNHEQAKQYIEDQLQSREASLVDGQLRGYIDLQKEQDMAAQQALGFAAMVAPIVKELISEPDEDEDEWDLE